MRAVDEAGWGRRGKRGKGCSGAEIIPTLGSGQVADTYICKGSSRPHGAKKKKALSPHRGQERPLVSGVEKAALLRLLLKREEKKRKSRAET